MYVRWPGYWRCIESFSPTIITIREYYPPERRTFDLTYIDVDGEKAIGTVTL